MKECVLGFVASGGTDDDEGAAVVVVDVADVATGTALAGGAVVEEVVLAGGAVVDPVFLWEPLPCCGFCS